MTIDTPTRASQNGSARDTRIRPTGASGSVRSALCAEPRAFADAESVSAAGLGVRLPAGLQVMRLPWPRRDAVDQNRSVA
jgi:hypothetical protein